MTIERELADVVVGTIHRALAPIVAQYERLAATVAMLDARPPVPGPPGEHGPQGDPGPAGPAGERGRDAEVPADELDPDTIAATFTDLLRKELGELASSPKRRVVRDGQGAVKFEIEDVT